MFVIKIQEVEADYKTKSTEIAFPSKEKAEQFVSDINNKQNHRIFLSLSICFLIFISVYSACVFYDISYSLQKISVKLLK